MRLLLLLVSIYSYAALAAAPVKDASTIPASVLDGFFPARSGDMVLAPTDMVATHQNDCLVMIQGEAVSASAEAPASLSAYNVADIVSRSLGVQPINFDYTPAFLQANAMQPAGANIMVSIDAVGASSIGQFGLANLAALRSSSPVSAGLDYDVYPSDDVSLATSIATGSSPSQHGVVSKSWINAKGESEQAYLGSSKATSSQLANVADVLLQTSAGQSLTVSVSSDAQQAAVYRVNPELQANTHWNNFVVSLNGESDFAVQGASASASASASSLSASRKAILEGLRSSEQSVLQSLVDEQAPVRATALFEDHMISIEYPVGADSERDSASFDLHQAADFALFAELQYLSTLPATLQSSSGLSSAVRDAVPDLYSFALAAPAALRAQYGAASKQYIAALHLIDAALPQLLTKLQALYPQSHAVTEIVLMGSKAPASAPVSISKTLVQHQAQLVNSQVYLPAAHSLSPEELTVLCNTVNTEASANGMVAICPALAPAVMATMSAGAPSFISRRSMADEEEGEATDAAGEAGIDTTTGGTVQDDSPPTNEEIQLYQIVLWTSITLTLTTFFAVMTLGTMEFKKDPLLYSTFNPDWDPSAN